MSISNALERRGIPSTITRTSNLWSDRFRAAIGPNSALGAH
jgi:hypothetical protein